MNDRPNDIKRIRPEIPKAKINDEMSLEEHFQNSTLRPIIKLQNPLLIAVFKNYILKRKNVFYNLTIDKKQHYIENALQKDMNFSNSIKGMVIGQFTVAEYEMYITHKSALNKRIINLVKERLVNQIQLFEQPSSLKAS